MPRETGPSSGRHVVLWGRIPRGNGGRVAAVLLVDNAAQPMQAAPVAALKGIAVSGNASKLHVIFTHFDQVKGDNLPGLSDREQHVLASVENVLKSIGDELGPAAERVLRRRIDQARFFVGGIQDPLDAKKAGSCSIQQLDAALNLLADPELAADAGPSRPVFNRMNLSLALMEAAKTFHTRWRGILGLDYNPDTHKDVYDFLVDSHPGLADLALWVREVVLTGEPDLTERVYPGWDGIGFRHPDAGYVCAIYPREQEQEVQLLFEHGVRLEDRDGLLEGAGTQTRFIRVRERDDRLAAAIGRCVHAAVAERLFRR